MRMVIVEAADLNRGYPDGIPNRLRLHMKDGRTYTKTVKYPRGHAGNPMSDQEVEDKFRRLAEGVISKRVQSKLLDEMWSLEKTAPVQNLWQFSVLGRAK